MSRHIASSLVIAALVLMTGCSPAPPELPPTVSTSTTRGPVTATVTLASDHIDIGSPQQVHIEILAEPRVAVQLPAFEHDEIPGFHVSSVSTRHDLPADGLRLWEVDLVIDTFDTSVEAFPSLTFAFTDRRAEIPIDGELSTDAIAVTLHSQIDPEDAGTQLLRDIRGHAGQPGEGSPWYWIIPASVVAVFAFLLWRWRSNHLSPRSVPWLPPHVAAMQRLLDLDRRDLIEHQRFHPFFVELSDILRTYVERRFSLRAPDLTTEEFLRDLGRTPLLGDCQKTTLGQFLRSADMVKFAKHHPHASDAHDAMATARQFVSDTAPVDDDRQEQVT